MKKSLLIITVLAVILGAMFFLGTGVKEKEDESIIVGMSGGYKPYTFTNDKGELVGFEVDVWQEISKRLDITVEFQTADFNGLFGLLDSNKIDTISNHNQ